jgi:transcriptional regulator with XRE-family HTH domain
MCETIRTPLRFDALNACTHKRITHDVILFLLQLSDRDRGFPQPWSDLIVEPEFASLTRRIGSRLRAERQRRGWSLSDLSARTADQLSKSRISNYEQGIRRMGLEAAHQIADALETVSPAWLLLLDEYNPLSDDELRLIQGFRAMDKAGQRQLLDMARGSEQ